jgi:hypothetical protein
MRSFLAALLLCLVSVASSEARTRHNESIPAFDRHAVYHVGSGAIIAERSARKVRTSGFKQIRKRHERERRSPTRQASRGEVQLLPHPVGCPSRAFCGCGASIEVFGRSIRELWLAAAWFKFPRAEPAPGMVAVRRHHVFVIREVRAPGLVLAYDANSGGRRTRLHLRSLAGFTVVNPRGSRYAAI